MPFVAAYYRALAAFSWELLFRLCYVDVLKPTDGASALQHSDRWYIYRCLEHAYLHLNVQTSWKRPRQKPS